MQKLFIPGSSTTVNWKSTLSKIGGFYNPELHGWLLPTNAVSKLKQINAEICGENVLPSAATVVASALSSRAATSTDAASSNPVTGVEAEVSRSGSWLLVPSTHGDTSASADTSLVHIPSLPPAPKNIDGDWYKLEIPKLDAQNMF